MSAKASKAATPNGSGNAGQNVHDVLRRLILESELPPGAEISQPELAGRLSVSRTPLREALRLLEREGLVVNAGPHKMVKVSTLTMPDLDDLYSLRVTGESLAVWLTVPRLRAADFEELEANLDRSFNAKTHAERAAAHQAFHDGLRLGTGPRLRDQLQRLFEHAERYQRHFIEYNADRMNAKHAEHCAILDACKARDRQAAREHLVDHLADTAMTLMTGEGYAPVALPTAVSMAKVRVPAQV